MKFSASKKKDLLFMASFMKIFIEKYFCKFRVYCTCSCLSFTLHVHVHVCFNVCVISTTGT